MSTTLYRPVHGYADLFAGMDGSIISGTKGRELKQTLRPDGYLFVRIPNVKQELAHRLVASAFLGPCHPDMEVRHGDGSRSHNQIANLCYGSVRDNAQDAMRHRTHQGAVMSAKVECPEGHQYSPENTYINPSTGSRHCRACRVVYMKQYNSDPINRARRAERRQARKVAR